MENHILQEPSSLIYTLKARINGGTGILSNNMSFLMIMTNTESVFLTSLNYGQIDMRATEKLKEVK